MKERPPLTIRRNFSWTLLGNTIYAASQWAMLTVLAKLGTPQMVGQFALSLAIATPIMTFANLSLRQVQATDARGTYQVGDYLGLRLCTTLLALVIIAGVAFTARYSFATVLVILAMGLAKSIEAVSDIIYGLLQHDERMDRVAISMIIKGILSLAALGIGVRLTHSLFWGVAGLVFAWACVLLAYDLRSGILALRARSQTGRPAPGVMVEETLAPRWLPGTMQRLAVLALPLGIAAMLASYSQNIPRLFIHEYLGSRELGIFTAMAYVLVAGSTVVTALGLAASPRLSRLHATGDARGFRSLLVKLMAVGAAMGGAGILVAMLGGRPLLTHLYKPVYATRTDVFLWLNIGAAIWYVASFLGFGMTCARYFKAQPIIYGLSCLVTSLCCWYLIPKHGLLGAAWAYVITGAVQMLAALLYSAYAIQMLNRQGKPALCDVGAAETV
jgi:O-antigen/teichoic acid export membrane protein